MHIISTSTSIPVNKNMHFEAKELPISDSVTENKITQLFIDVSGNPALLLYTLLTYGICELRPDATGKQPEKIYGELIDILDQLSIDDLFECDVEKPEHQKKNKLFEKIKEEPKPLGEKRNAEMRAQFDRLIQNLHKKRKNVHICFVGDTVAADNTMNSYCILSLLKKMATAGVDYDITFGRSAAHFTLALDLNYRHTRGPLLCDEFYKPASLKRFLRTIGQKETCDTSDLIENYYAHLKLIPVYMGKNNTPIWVTPEEDMDSIMAQLQAELNLFIEGGDIYQKAHSINRAFQKMIAAGGLAAHVTEEGRWILGSAFERIMPKMPIVFPTDPKHSKDYDEDELKDQWVKPKAVRLSIEAHTHSLSNTQLLYTEVTPVKIKPIAEKLSAKMMNSSDVLAYPKLYTLFPHPQFNEVIAEIKKYFSSLFDLSTLNHCAIHYPDNSYLKWFLIITKNLTKTKGIPNIRLEIKEALFHKSSLDYITTHLLIIPPDAQSKQLTYIEKILFAQETSGIQALSLLDMMRLGTPQKKGDPQFRAIELSWLEANEQFPKEKCVFINIRSHGEIPLWGVLCYSNYKSIWLFFCESPLSRTDKNRIKAHLGSEPIEFFDNSTAPSISSGYTALAWAIEQNYLPKVGISSFTPTSDMLSILTNVFYMMYQQTSFDAKSFSDKEAQWLDRQIIPFVIKSSDRAPNTVPPPLAIWSALLGSNSLSDLAGDNSRCCSISALLKIQSLSGKQPTFDMYNFGPSFSAALRQGWIAYESTADSAAFSLQGPYDRSIMNSVLDDVDYLEAQQPENIRRKQANFQELERERIAREQYKDSPQNIPKAVVSQILLYNRALYQKVFESDMAFVEGTIICFFRSMFRKSTLTISISEGFPITPHTVNFLCKLLQDNVFVVEILMKVQHPALVELNNALTPLFARNNWLHMNGYLRPMYDNFWMRAALYSLIFMANQGITPPPDEISISAYRKLSQGMSIHGFNAILSLLADESQSKRLHQLLSQDGLCFFVSCNECDGELFMRALINHIKNKCYFPFQNIKIDPLELPLSLWSELIHEVNLLPSLNEVHITLPKNVSDDEVSIWLNELCALAKDKQWNTFVVSSPLSSHKANLKQLDELDKLNAQIRLNRHARFEQQLLPQLENKISAIQREDNQSEHEEDKAHGTALDNIPPFCYSLEQSARDLSNFGVEQEHQMHHQRNSEKATQQESNVDKTHQKNSGAPEPIQSSINIINFDNIDSELGEWFLSRLYNYPKYYRTTLLGHLSDTSGTCSILQRLYTLIVGVVSKKSAPNIIQGLSIDAAKKILMTPHFFMSGINPDNLPRGYLIQDDNNDGLILCFSRSAGLDRQANSFTTETRVRVPNIEAQSGITPLERSVMNPFQEELTTREDVLAFFAQYKTTVPKKMPESMQNLMVFESYPFFKALIEFEKSNYDNKMSYIPSFFSWDKKAYRWSWSDVVSALMHRQSQELSLCAKKHLQCNTAEQISGLRQLAFGLGHYGIMTYACILSKNEGADLFLTALNDLIFSDQTFLERSVQLLLLSLLNVAEITYTQKLEFEFTDSQLFSHLSSPCGTFFPYLKPQGRSIVNQISPDLINFFHKLYGAYGYHLFIFIASTLEKNRLKNLLYRLNEELDACKNNPQSETPLLKTIHDCFSTLFLSLFKKNKAIAELSADQVLMERLKKERDYVIQAVLLNQSAPFFIPDNNMDPEMWKMLCLQAFFNEWLDPCSPSSTPELMASMVNPLNYQCPIEVRESALIDYLSRNWSRFILFFSRQNSSLEDYLPLFGDEVIQNQSPSPQNLLTQSLTSIECMKQKEWCRKHFASDTLSMGLLQVSYTAGNKGLIVIIKLLMTLEEQLGKEFSSFFINEYLARCTNFSFMLKEDFFKLISKIIKTLETDSILKKLFLSISQRHYASVGFEPLASFWNAFMHFINSTKEMGLYKTGDEFDALQIGDMRRILERVQNILWRLPTASLRHAFIAQIAEVDLRHTGLFHAVEEGIIPHDLLVKKHPMRLRNFEEGEAGYRLTVMDIKKLYLSLSEATSLNQTGKVHLRRTLACQEGLSSEDYETLLDVIHELPNPFAILALILHGLKNATTNTLTDWINNSLKKWSSFTLLTINKAISGEHYLTQSPDPCVNFNNIGGLGNIIMYQLSKESRDRFIKWIDCFENSFVFELLQLMYRKSGNFGGIVQLNPFTAGAVSFMTSSDKEHYKTSLQLALLLDASPEEQNQLMLALAKNQPEVHQLLSAFLNRLIKDYFGVSIQDNILQIKKTKLPQITRAVENYQANPSLLKSIIDKWMTELQISDQTASDVRYCRSEEYLDKEWIRAHFPNHVESISCLLKHIVLNAGDSVNKQLTPLIQFLLQIQSNSISLNETEAILAICSKLPEKRYWHINYFLDLLHSLIPDGLVDGYPIGLLDDLLNNAICAPQPINLVEPEFPEFISTTINLLLKKARNQEEKILLLSVCSQLIFWCKGNSACFTLLSFLDDKSLSVRKNMLNLLKQSKSLNDYLTLVLQCKRLFQNNVEAVPSIMQLWPGVIDGWLQHFHYSPYLGLYELINRALKQDDEQWIYIAFILSHCLSIKEQSVNNALLVKKASKLFKEIKYILDDSSSHLWPWLASQYPNPKAPGIDQLRRLLKSYRTHGLEFFKDHFERSIREANQLTPSPDICPTRMNDLFRMLDDLRLQSGSTTESLTSKERYLLVLQLAQTSLYAKSQLKIAECDELICNLRDATLYECLLSLNKKEKALSTLEDSRSKDELFAIKAQIWAILFALLWRYTGLYPNDAQQIALLADPTKMGSKLFNILQMGTGEGKSVVITLFLARYSLQNQGNVCYALTTKLDLSRRDFDTSRSFWPAIGLKSMALSIDSDPEQVAKHDIIYATPDMLSIWKASQALKGTKLDSRDALAVVDEIDSIANSRTPANLARSDLSILNTKDRNDYYSVCNSFFKAHVQGCDSITDNTLRHFVSYLRTHYANKENRKIYLKMLENNPAKLLQWLLSSFIAHEKIHRNEDYSIIDEQVGIGNTTASVRNRVIVPLSRSDNSRMLGSIFGKGVQQLLAVRHNAEEGQQGDKSIHSPLLSEILFSHIASADFSEEFSAVVGFTATVSQIEARRWADIYGAQVLKIATNKITRRSWESPVFYDNEAQRIDELLATLEKSFEARESVLIACNNDAQVVLLQKYLDKCSKKYPGQFIYHTNESTESTEDMLIRKRHIEEHYNKSTVLVASSLGRGDNVGVHIVIILNATTHTNIIQAGGRTARFGAPGKVLQSYLWEEIDRDYKYVCKKLQVSVVRKERHEILPHLLALNELYELSSGEMSEHAQHYISYISGWIEKILPSMTETQRYLTCDRLAVMIEEIKTSKTNIDISAVQTNKQKLELLTTQVRALLHNFYQKILEINPIALAPKLPILKALDLEQLQSDVALTLPVSQGNESIERYMLARLYQLCSSSSSSIKPSEMDILFNPQAPVLNVLKALRHPSLDECVRYAKALPMEHLVPVIAEQYKELMSHCQTGLYGEIPSVLYAITHSGTVEKDINHLLPLFRWIQRQNINAHQIKRYHDHLTHFISNEEFSCILPLIDKWDVPFIPAENLIAFVTILSRKQALKTNADALKIKDAFIELVETSRTGGTKFMDRFSTQTRMMHSSDEFLLFVPNFCKVYRNCLNIDEKLFDKLWMITNKAWHRSPISREHHRPALMLIWKQLASLKPNTLIKTLSLCLDSTAVDYGGKKTLKFMTTITGIAPAVLDLLVNDKFFNIIKRILEENNALVALNWLGRLNNKSHEGDPDYQNNLTNALKKYSDKDPIETVHDLLLDTKKFLYGDVDSEQDEYASVLNFNQ